MTNKMKEHKKTRNFALQIKFLMSVKGHYK